MKITRRILIIALAIVLTGGVVLNTQAADERSYAQMMEDWHFSSSQLQEVAINLNVAERSYQEALENATRASITYSRRTALFRQLGMDIPDAMKFSIVLQRDLARIQAEQTWEMEQAQAVVLNTKYEIELRGAYLNYMQAANNLELQRIRLEIATINRQKQTLAYDLGQMSETDFLTQEADYQEAIISCNQAERQLQLMRINLNALIDVPMDTVYQSAYTEFETDLGIFNIDYYLSDAFESNLTLRQDQKQLETFDFQIAAYENFHLDETSEEQYNDLLLNRQEQALLYGEALLSVEKDVRETVLDLQYNMRNLRLVFNEHNDQLHNWEEAQALFAAGTIDKTQLLMAELSYIQAYNTYNCAVYEYNTFIMKFQATVTTGFDLPNASASSAVNRIGGMQ